MPERPKGLDSGSSGLVPSRVRIPPPASFIFYYYCLIVMRLPPYLKFSELEQMVSDRGYFLMGINLNDNKCVFGVEVDEERSKILFFVFGVPLLIYLENGTVYDISGQRIVKCNYVGEDLESLIQLVSRPLNFFERKDFVYHSNQQGVLQYYGYRQDGHGSYLRYLGPKIESEIMSYWPKVFKVTVNSLFDGQNEILSVNKPPRLEIFSNYIRIMDLSYSLRISDSYVSLAQVVNKNHMLGVQVDFHKNLKINTEKLEFNRIEGQYSKKKINFLKGLISNFKHQKFL